MGKAYRTLKIQLTNDEWYELRKLKAELKCDTWRDFIGLFLKNKKKLRYLFEKLPP